MTNPPDTRPEPGRDDQDRPVVVVTDAARSKILEVRAGEPEPDTVALAIEITGVSGGAYVYDMMFVPLDEAGDDDVVQRHDDLSIVIRAGSVAALAGATLDFTSAGMIMDNPNRPVPPGAMPLPEADLSTPVAQAVARILDEQINPAIAAHGGRADLVAVDGSIVYLRLGGGCQGCGMASVTLSQGIEVAILDALPEITEVVDVTDHASGSNPYYEAAKK